MSGRFRREALVAGLLVVLAATLGAQNTGGRREPSSGSGGSQGGGQATGRRDAPPPQPQSGGNAGQDEQKAQPRRSNPPAQQRGSARAGQPSRPLEPWRPLYRGQVVFVGGYFYDPFYGPYPWWPRYGHPYGYFPIYDQRAFVRMMVKPNTAAVYVDGFYAGIVDDFDNPFQSLPLPPGGHEIALYLDGFRTVRRQLYLRPGTTLSIRENLEPLPPRVASEPPTLAPPIPPPPPGTYNPPRTAPYGQPRPPSQYNPPPASADGYGTFTLHVQPADAEVRIDGELWESSAEGRFVIQVTAGQHHVEISKRGYQRFETDIRVRDGEEAPLNVSLSPDRR